MHLPPHPVWFWLILLSPFLIWLTLWIVAQNSKVSLKPLRPWFVAGTFLFFVPYVLLGVQGGNKTVKTVGFVAQAAFYTCLWASLWIQRRYMFDTLRSPNAKWYSMWKPAEFSVPAPNLRILVRDVDAVSPWYIGKLGLRKSSEAPPTEPSATIFRFKADGNPIILTTSPGFQTGKTPILFTKKIGRMRDVMSARGVDVGKVEQDRQGLHYFQIHDPEGNLIEVVEDR
jgi:predicted enzyme related to lactoylglutathione lyase